MYKYCNKQKLHKVIKNVILKDSTNNMPRLECIHPLDVLILKIN